MFNDFTEFGRMIYGFFAQGTKLTYAAMGIGLVISILYFRIFFRSLSDFREAWADSGGGMTLNRFSGRISFWLIISIGSGVLAYYQLPEWFPHLFGNAK